MFWQALHWNNDLSPGLSKHLPLPFHNEDTVINSLPLFCIYDCSISINQKFSGRKSCSGVYWFLTNFQTTFKDVSSATELKLHFCKSRFISLHPVGFCWIYTGVTNSTVWPTASPLHPRRQAHQNKERHRQAQAPATDAAPCSQKEGVVPGRLHLVSKSSTCAVLGISNWEFTHAQQHC